MSVYIKNFGEFTNFKYVDSNRNTHDIKSVYYGPALVWPQEYKVKITPSFSSRRLAPTANYTTVQWNTTIYYPNSDIVVAEGTINSNEVDNVVIQVSKDQSTWTTVTSSDSSYSGNNTINGTWSFQSKGTNGLGSSGNNNPISDGPWYYRISCRIPYTILNKTYYAVYINNTSYDVMVNENTYSLIDTTYSRLSLKYYNSGRPKTENTDSTPAPYTGIDVYPELSCREHDTYRYTSEDEYTHTYWPDSVNLRDFNWSSDKNWASVDREGTVTLALNTDTSNDRYATITVSFGDNERATKKVYQSVAPDPNSSS